MNFQLSFESALEGVPAADFVVVAIAGLAFFLGLQLVLVQAMGRWEGAAVWSRGALFGSALFSLSLIPLLGTERFAARLSVSGLSVPHAVGLGIQLDRLGAVMLALTGFLGAVVVGFSSTYLRNEAQRPRFLMTLGKAVFLVQAFVLQSNLIGHALVWLGISWQVHRLLRHYDDRPRARLAARKKFLISRLGDACFYVGLLLLLSEFSTLDLQELELLASSAGSVRMGETVAVLLICCAALLKSAQFPFHSWLPETMDAPTPVSALMHAGVVNAGAFLLLDLSPLLGRSPAALLLLVGVGATSAAVGSVVGSLQSSRKVTLAWSTIAQMGFLFFELGLGFSGAALLHMIAHGVYKAHAFLRSGTASDSTPRSRVGAPAALTAVGVSLGLLALGVLVLSPRLGPPSWEALALAAVWTVASSQYLLGPAHVSFARRFGAYLLLGGGVWAGVWLSEARLSAWLAADLHGPGEGGPGALAVVIAGVAALSVAIVLTSVRRWEGRILQPLAVHLHSGLYFGEVSDALTRLLWPDDPSSASASARSPGV